jgi:uncharacterized membrane protein
MISYTADQWVLFFFFYCLCGWVWESCYVSARQRRWVNRGFLHGPLLPIYGFGAIIILLVTLRVQDSLWLIYLFGMVAATALEYVTGAAMEALFHVRYWDYSNQKCNLNGHICLTCSLAWGVFSVLLVRLIHPPVARLVLAIPQFLAEPLAFVLVAGTTVDAVQSFRAAMDLREILTRLTEENEDLRRIARRAEVVSAFAEDDLRRFRERTEIDKLLLSDQLEAAKARLEQERAMRALRREEATEERLRRRTSAKLQALHSVAEALEDYRSRLTETKELTGQALTDRLSEISEALEKLRTTEVHVLARSARTYRQSLRILRGNPTASTKKYAEALENLRSLGGLKK